MRGERAEAAGWFRRAEGAADRVEAHLVLRVHLVLQDHPVPAVRVAPQGLGQGQQARSAVVVESQAALRVAEAQVVGLADVEEL